MPKNIDPMDAEWCAERLDPHDAMLLSDFDSQYKSLHRTGDLVRVWNVDADDIWALVDFLNYYTDRDNTSQTNFIDDPQVGAEVFDGRYRQAFVRVDTRGGSSRIVQVLRKGYLTEVDWDEARWGTFNRVVNGNDTADPNGDGSDLSKEQFYTAKFIGVEPSVARDFSASLENSEVTDPTIDFETVTGTFAVIRHDHRVEEDDGSVTYELLLADADYRVVSYQNKLTPEERQLTYIYNVPKKDIHTITAEFQNTVGATVRLSEEKRGGFFDVVVTTRPQEITQFLLNVATAIECGEEAEVTNYYWGVEEADVVDLSTLTLEPGWTVRMSGPSLRSDGLFNYSYSIRKNVAKSIDWYDSVRNCIRNSFEQKYVDQDSNDVAAIVFPENEPGVTIQVDRTKKAGCLEDIQIQKTETIEATVTHAFNTRYGTGTITVGKYMRDLADMPTGTVGNNTNVTLIINDDCTYNWVVIDTPSDQNVSEFDYVNQIKCGDITSRKVQADGVDAALDFTTVTLEAGEILSVGYLRERADGKFDYQYTITSPDDREIEEYLASDSHLSSANRAEYINKTVAEAAAIDIPIQEQGKIVRVDKGKPISGCLENISVTSVTSKPVRETFYFNNGQIDIGLNQPDVQLPSYSSNDANSVSIDINQDGTFSWKASSYPKTNAISGDEGELKDQTTYVREKTSRAHVPYINNWKLKYDVLFTTSAFEARQYLNGGEDGSRVYGRGKGIYEAFKVTSWTLESSEPVSISNQGP